MGRWGCVEVPSLPLQLLLRRTGDDGPAAVVAEDAPLARVLWVNEAARRRGILPGQRHAAALALCRTLRAGVVEADEVEAATARIARRLRDFTPGVEPSPDEPGVFWLDGDGLGGLFGSASAWGRDVRRAVLDLGFACRVVVGFTRYGAYAVAADAGVELAVFRDPESEQRAARAVPLARLGLDPELRDELERLGVRTLGAFLELPEGALHERYGDAASRLHRLASGAAWAPLQPRLPEERFVESLELGYPEGNRERLLLYLRRALDALVERLAARGLAACGLRLTLRLDVGGERADELRPARPTRDAARLAELLRLRLEGAELSGKVEELALEALAAPAEAEQAALPEGEGRRDVAAAERALARLRAEFGAQAVVRARLRDGHLPAATFLWAPLEPSAFEAEARVAAGARPRELEAARAREFEAARRRDAARPDGDAARAREFNAERRRDADGARALGVSALPFGAPRDDPGRGPLPVLVRRVYPKPIPLPPRPHHLRDDGWLVRDVKDGAVRRLVGPFVVGGGWWAAPIQREYHYAETVRGDLLWVFHDPLRRRWFLEGQVE